MATVVFAMESPGTNRRRVNRVSAGLVMLLSLTALLPIVVVLLRIALTGQVPALERDEGTGGHVFQLSIAGLVPALLVFLASADWARPWRVARTLTLPAVAIVLAFALLYHYEHP
ncbi:MAG TPA: hypothetical protein VIO62_18110 [Candidatus Dormibacteraeota bacterium]